jgi:hypothetical protein
LVFGGVFSIETPSLPVGSIQVSMETPSLPIVGIQVSMETFLLPIGRE